MKIATWNIERLKHLSDLAEVQNLLDGQQADILVLTETHTQFNLQNYRYNVHSSQLVETDTIKYDPTENRISIYTNYKIVRLHETYDNFTARCVELKTDYGNLLVYGSIIGIYGNRHKNFKTDLSQQICDYKKLSREKNFCLIGDYNISFADNYYFTNNGRNELNKVFKECNLNLLTRDKTECIDHIAISENYLRNLDAETGEWNLDKKLSDHKGIYVNLKNNNEKQQND